MIRSAQIKEFRCLDHVQLSFEPLTVLVGPNASGKSTLLAALDARTGWSERDHWRLKKNASPSVSITSDDGSFQRSQTGGWQGAGNRPNLQFLHLDRQTVRRANQVSEERLLSPDGRNLTNVFATLTRGQKQDIAEQLSKLVPVLSDVDARPLAQGNHRLVFQDRWRPEVWYEPAEVSDGTMLVLAFLVCQLQVPQVDVLAIEEPERGLHPYLLGRLMDLFRGMSTGDVGPRPVQIILATHSVELLEFAKPEEVRFLSREEDGRVKIEAAPTGTEAWDEAIREYENSMGQMWLSGSLGGVPGA